jgi:hypothetical protein
MTSRKTRQASGEARNHSLLDIALFAALAAVVLIAIAGRPTPALGTDPARPRAHTIPQADQAR